MWINNLDQIISFGKYKNQIIRDVLFDIDYWGWVLNKTEWEFDGEVAVKFFELNYNRWILELDTNVKLHSEDNFWKQRSEACSDNFLKTIV